MGTDLKKGLVFTWIAAGLAFFWSSVLESPSDDLFFPGIIFGICLTVFGFYCTKILLYELVEKC